MRLLVGLVALLPLVHGNTGARCNDSTPFAIPYTNVTVLDSPPIIQSPHKTLPLLFGSQRKLLAMGFGTTANSSFVPDSDRLCNQSHPDVRSCIFWRGGVFTPQDSKTWVKDKRTSDYNGSASNEGWDYLNAENYKDQGDDPLTQFTRGWDNVDLGPRTLYSFPFSIIENSSFPFGTGMIGLASDSVFLKASVAAGLSPSRTWGFDFGRTGLELQEDGELVIGGYNPAKASYRDFTNYTIFPDKTKPCPLQVNVQSMKWGETDLMAGQDPFMACLEPAYWTMILPLTVQQNWNRSMINDHGYNFWKETWEYFYYNNTNTSAFPQGDLEITLNKGFSVKIPRDELFEQAQLINATRGGWDPIDGSIQVKHGTAGFPPGVDPKLPFLGGPFLSQVYLAVDYENNVFSIAHTNRAASPAVGLIKLACDGVIDSSPGKNKTGAIVGGSVGGVLGLVAIVGLLYYFLVYRKRKQQAEPYVPSNVDPAQISDKKDDVPRYTSPFAPYGAYPPPPPESVISAGSPHPTYNGSHYSGPNTFSTSPPMPPQHPMTDADERGFMLASTRLEPVEIGPGQRDSMITPLAEQSPVNAPYSPDPNTAGNGMGTGRDQRVSM